MIGVRGDVCMDLGNGLANGQGKHPLLSFGVISDVQYADIPDGHTSLGVPRYYRHSILVLQRAVKNWNDHKNLNFVINFGDIIDGKCPKDQSLNAVKKVASEFENFHSPVYHMIGNHCLYSFPRDKLLPLLKIPNHGDGRTHAYYDFSPTPGYRFVVLDGYDIKNPNSDKYSPEGLKGVDRRFVKHNGAVGNEQMEWLDNVLKDATNMKQKVQQAKKMLLWNYDQVMDLIQRYDCVKVCLSGHNHQEGYSFDSRGVHHRVLNAASECPPGTNAFGYIDVYDKMLSLVGTDRVKSTGFCFDF
ncbi:hypothetical protein ERO13_D12G188312v2 [Gossypium hirsutum]|uniref:Manganese-dependent ADP-ribose/CDP-alcohol diphosphatase n=2 Tax=Gossypium TaxID=3633 RepID=A0A0D2SRQ9_GOSRA|nr:hypothetical protein ERO13_D12G188312v2 [Gossypium hirsutum]KJB46774.1 hypothetical protein B456_008G202100 [Gossypium raimondii]TYI51963.1 hypothetical protein E1A91_D12G212400v1 [Gossypium mustelinum]